MNPFNQFWKKYIDDNSADISIAKRKQEISRWLLIYALVVLALRGVEFIVFGHVLLFFGENLIAQSFGSGFITLFFIYSLPLLMWVYSIRASRPEELLIWYLFFDKFGLFLSFFSSFFSWGFRGIVIGSGFFLVNLLITKKVKRLEKLCLLEDPVVPYQPFRSASLGPDAKVEPRTDASSTLTPLTEEESRVEKNEFLRNSANAMLFLYGLVALYPRLTGSFMRVGIWDFVFSGMPRSWWNIALYSLIPFAVCFYSIKTKKTDKLILGYSLWLVFDNAMAFALSTFWFLSTITIEAEVPSENTFLLNFFGVLRNYFLCRYALYMSKSYVDSLRVQKGLPDIVKKKKAQVAFEFIFSAIVLLLLRATLLALVVIGVYLLLIVIDIIRGIINLSEYFWEKDTPVAFNANVHDAGNKNREPLQLDIKRITFFLIVFSHIIYAIQAWSSLESLF